MRTLIALSLFAVWASPCLAEDYQLKLPLGLKRMKMPKDNALSEAKIKLGKQLYFDARLSKDNTISCASCHDPKKGWSNGEQFATGFKGQKGGRNSPTIINAGFQYFQFWDGRAAWLEGQALGPIENPIEMAMPIKDLIPKLNKIDGYRSQFQAIYKTDVTAAGIAKSIASFERTVLSGNAPYDRYKAGDKSALSESAERGRKLFFGKANCSACHGGQNFTDGAFHNVGVGYDGKSNKPKDVGRYSQTELEGDTGSFKTPGLRDIARSAPYMHDGSMKTLKEVVEHYNKGGVPNPQLDEEIFEMKLNKQQVEDLVKFLEEGLSSSSYPDFKPPALPK